jgi:hypothetical protein
MVFNTGLEPGKDAAVRKAIAYTIDRQAIADNVYNGTVEPLYSMVPAGIAGHIDAFQTTYGEAPDKAKAQAALRAAGVQTPLPVQIWWTPTHYGDSSADEYAEIKRALDGSGLFNVTLKSTEWDAYSEAYAKDQYRSCSSAGSRTTQTQTTTSRRSTPTDNFARTTTRTSGWTRCSPLRRPRPTRPSGSRSSSRSSRSLRGTCRSSDLAGQAGRCGAGRHHGRRRDVRPVLPVPLLADREGVRGRQGGGGSAPPPLGSRHGRAQHTTSLRTYALTRLALALPMVWILLTMVFVLMRVAPVT